jgi:hypothetical protein
MLERDYLCTLRYFKDRGRVIPRYTEQHPVFEGISEVGNYPIDAMFVRKTAHEYADAFHVSINQSSSFFEVLYPFLFVQRDAHPIAFDRSTTQPDERDSKTGLTESK